MLSTSRPPVVSVTPSSVTNLKDVPVVLYEVSDGAAGDGVLPVCLEQRGAEHYGQVTEVHLVILRTTLHAETRRGNTRGHKEVGDAERCDRNSRRGSHQWRWLIRACSVALLTKGSRSSSSLYLEIFCSSS